MSNTKIKRHTIIAEEYIGLEDGDYCYSEDVSKLEAVTADLYEALEEAVEMLEGMLASFNVEGADMYVGSDDIEVMKAALAKARGES